MIAFHAGLSFGRGLRKQAESESDWEPVSGESGSPIQLAEWLAKNPNPSDEQFHAHAEQQGKEPDDLEAIAYRLATHYAKFLTDGRAKEKGVKPSDVSQAELTKGIKVEKEHTPEPSVAARIALDHEAEIPDYYTRLKKMEEEAGIKD